MVRLLFSIFRDLYVVLLVILIAEQIPGSDLLHDLTRKGVIAVTVCVIVAKICQPLFGRGGSGAPRGGARRDKQTSGGHTSQFEWASAEMQGWRPAMEDATCVVDVLAEPLADKSLFGVFDGHGGSQVSLIASKEFPKVLAACATNIKAAGNPKAAVAEEASAKGDGAEAVASRSEDHAGGMPKATPDAAPMSSSAFLRKSLNLAMLTMDAFLRKGGADLAARSDGKAHHTLSQIGQQMSEGDKKNAFNLVGSTAIVVIMDCADSSPRIARPIRVTAANCGDSRAILCRKGKAIELSEDHKPELQREEERIKKAGGHVAQIGPCHRIDGWGLNLSRALGDFHYKGRSDLPPEEQKVCAVPEVRSMDLCDDDEFLVLACDGCFELNTSQKVVDIVRQGFLAGLSTEKVAEDLVDKSCSQNLMKTRGKGGDNCSTVIVRFLWWKVGAS